MVIFNGVSWYLTVIAGVRIIVFDYKYWCLMFSVAVDVGVWWRSWCLIYNVINSGVC